MTETNKEYKLRCLCADIMGFVENATNDFDDLCDCDIKSGLHEQLCKTILMRKDFEEFNKKLQSTL